MDKKLKTIILFFFTAISGLGGFYLGSSKKDVVIISLDKVADKSQYDTVGTSGQIIVSGKQANAAVSNSGSQKNIPAAVISATSSNASSAGSSSANPASVSGVMQQSAPIVVTQTIPAAASPSPTTKVS